MHIRDGSYLATALFGASFGFSMGEENANRDADLEWFKSGHSTFGVSLGSVWQRKTLTGVHTWVGSNWPQHVLSIVWGQYGKGKR